MGRNSLTLRAPASSADFDLLPMWYEMAGVSSNEDDGADDVSDFRDAWERGRLGGAIGGGFRKNLETLISLDQTQWPAARTTLRLLALNGEQIGAIVLGAHHRLWNFVGKFTSTDPDAERGTMKYMTTILTCTKVHAVAVHPEHRGRGHGSRLLRTAKSIGERDGLLKLYGQFSADRRGLLEFYSASGFRVLDPGEPLDMEMATGRPGDLMGCLPTDRYFEWLGNGPKPLGVK